MSISSDKLYLPFLCKALNYCPSVHAVNLVCVDEQGHPIAGVVYDGYNGQVISAHIWIDAERRPLREWFAMIFDYPFNRLGAYKIIGHVDQSNQEAVRLNEHFGFCLEAMIEGFFDTGAPMRIYTMRRDQCRLFKDPKWRKYVDYAAGRGYVGD